MNSKNFESGSDYPKEHPESLANIAAEAFGAVPDKCRDCPFQCYLANVLRDALMQKRLITDFGGKLVGRSGDEFDAIIDENIPEEVASEFKKLTREGVANDLDKTDEIIDMIKQDMIDNSNKCSTPLKMRAKKGETTYQVDVCTSPEQFGDKHAPTHVRQTVNPDS